MGFPFKGSTVAGKQRVVEYREGLYHSARDPSVLFWPESYDMRWSGGKLEQRMRLARALLSELDVDEEVKEMLAIVLERILLPALPATEWTLVREDVIEVLVNGISRLLANDPDNRPADYYGDS